MLHRRGVHAGVEMNALRVTAGPPVPGRLAGLDPRRVGNRRGRVQVEQDVRLDQPPRLLSQHHDAPRRSERRSASHRHLGLSGGAPAGPRERTSWSRGQGTSPRSPRCRFRDRHPGHSRQLGEQWQGDEPLGVQTAEQPPLVFVLIRGGVVPQDKRVRRGVLGEPELGTLPGHADLSQSGLFGDEVTEGHPVVVRPRFDREQPTWPILLRVVDVRGPVAVTDRVGLSCRNAVSLIPFARLGIHQLAPAGSGGCPSISRPRAESTSTGLPR